MKNKKMMKRTAATIMADTLETQCTIFAEQEAADTMIVDGVEITNSYDNTDALLENFPIEYPTTIDSELEKNIKNRLLTGMTNWNRGIDAWKAWGSILYTEDSIYNVHGAHLSLTEYQAAMDASLSKVWIEMGAFHNIIVTGDWTAIFYDITTVAGDNEIPGRVMEFVKFKDYGDDLGTRVVEGWGSTKDQSFENMSLFMTQGSRTEQDAYWQSIIDYEIPETENLEEKYIVLNPTEHASVNGEAMMELILKDFDTKNQGVENYKEFADDFYTADAVYHTKEDESLTVDELKVYLERQQESMLITGKYFDNILICDDWAATHYRAVRTNADTGDQEAFDVMQFMHFVEDNGTLKVDETWIG